MGKRGAQQRLYRAAACASDDAAPLERLTRAELIRIIAKLKTQPRSNGIDGKAVSRPTMLVNESVRSGQRVTFEDGDLIVVGSVASGAEVVAGGSIHVYGALRGRAHAGTSDPLDARIFCQKLEAELLAIGGICRMFDDFETNLRGRPAHAWRATNTIRLAALCKLENLQGNLEHIKARPSLGQTELAEHPALGRLSWARPLSWVWRLTATRGRQHHL